MLNSLTTPVQGRTFSGTIAKGKSMTRNTSVYGRREFFGHLTRAGATIALASTAAGSLFMMEGCSATTDLQLVLKLLPTVGGIVLVVGNLVAALDPGIGSVIGSALSIVGASFSDIQAIIAKYKTNIAGMPATTLERLDGLIAAVASQMTVIEGQFHGISAALAAGINVGLAAFQAILGYLGAILPTPVAAARFPKAFAAMSARGVKFGAAMISIPSERAFAKDFNSKMDAAGFHGNHIHVDWVHLGPVPIAP